MAWEPFIYPLGKGFAKKRQETRKTVPVVQMKNDTHTPGDVTKKEQQVLLGYGTQGRLNGAAMHFAQISTTIQKNHRRGFEFRAAKRGPR